MELGSLEIQIFVSLTVILGTAFVALVCDFLKGNNEQLRERNLELRVRQEERDRLGLSQPAQWLQGLAALARNPQLVESMATASASGTPAATTAAQRQSAPRVSTPVAPVHSGPEAPVNRVMTQPVARPAAGSVAADEAEARSTGSRRRYEEDRGQRGATWARKEELEQLAERAARIRARHEASTRKATLSGPEAARPETEVRQEPKPQESPAARTAAETKPGGLSKLPDPLRVKVHPIDRAPERLEAREHLDLDDELSRVASFANDVEPVAEPATPAVSAAPVSTTPAAAFAVQQPDVAESVPVSRVPEPVRMAERAPQEPPAPTAAQQVIAGASATEPEGVSPTVVMPKSSARPPVVEELTQPEPLAAAEPDVQPELDHEAHPEKTSAPGIWIDERPPVYSPQVTAEFSAGDLFRAPVSEPVRVAASEQVASTAQRTETPVEREEPVVANAEPAHTAVGASPVVAASDQAAPVCELAVPAGMHDSSVLSSLLEDSASYTGVVVAIGINEYESLREKLTAPSGADSLEALHRMVLSMLRQHDFACRFQEDEFLLLFPGETGAAAQRRLFQVSEKLWDFQLRSLGQLSVMFSWGGFEVQREPLPEAVSSARERMFQTKRSRKPAPFDLASPKKRVVNG